MCRPKANVFSCHDNHKPKKFVYIIGFLKEDSKAYTKIKHLVYFKLISKHLFKQCIVFIMPLELIKNTKSK